MTVLGCIVNLISSQFKNSPRLNNSRGTILFVLAMVMVLSSVIMVGLNAYLLRKNESQIGVMKYTRIEGIINAVLDHAVNELKASFAAGGACSLQPLVAITSTFFRPVAPQYYHVGQFQLDILDAAGLPTGRFESPEEPPMVYITQIGTAELYKIHIKTAICKVAIGGSILRPNKIPKTTVDANVTAEAINKPWSSPPTSYTWAAHGGGSCPEVIPLEYVGVIDPASWGGIWTLYFDRGFNANMGQYEPSELAQIDAEEFYDGKESSEYISSIKSDVLITGATDEVGLPVSGGVCELLSRTNIAYFQILNAIKTQDPCGKLAMYTVGGNVATGTAPSPPWKIDPIIPDVPPGISKYLPITTDWSTLTTEVRKACAKRPAGYYNIPEVLKHYTTNHQKPLHTLPPNERSKTHVLVLVTDATGYGTLRPPSEPSLGAGVRRPIIRSNIYFKSENCSGQGYIEKANLNIAPTDWYVAGDQLYEFNMGASAPAPGPFPNTSPPLAPLPGASSTVVRSVVDAFTGVCATIIQTAGAPPYDAYTGAEYPYFLKEPQAVNPRAATPSTMKEVLDAYKPYKGWLQAFANVANNSTGGIKDYPNAFMMFPLPVTDLDEFNIVDNAQKYSRRTYDIGEICQKDRESLAVGYSQVFSMLDLKKFSAKASYEGLICN